MSRFVQLIALCGYVDAVKLRSGAPAAVVPDTEGCGQWPALLACLNVWSPSSIATNLHVDLDTAHHINNRRLKLGGLLMSPADLDGLNGFNATSHLCSANVEETYKRERMMMPALSWGNSVELWDQGAGNLELLLNEIRTATKYVHISTFLWYDDDAGRQLSKACEDAANRGVQLRIMIPFRAVRFFSWFDTRNEPVYVKAVDHRNGIRHLLHLREACKAIKASNHDAICEVVNSGSPIDEASNSDMAEMERAMRKGAWTRPLSVMGQHLSHQKIMLIDGHLVLMSLNLASMYLWTNTSQPNRWRDGASRIHGPAVLDAQRIFTELWVSAGGDHVALNGVSIKYTPDSDFPESWLSGSCAFPEDSACSGHPGNATVALMSNIPGAPYNINLNFLSDMVRTAKENVYVENPYITDEYFWEQLHLSKATGIHLLTGIQGGDSVHALIRLGFDCGAYNSGIPQMTVHDYYGGKQFSHIKLAVDATRDLVHYGSYNIDGVSRDDMEASVVVRDPKFAKDILAIVQRDIDNSQAIQWNKKPRRGTCTLQKRLKRIQ